MINCVFVTGNLSAKILYELWYLLHFVVPQSGLMLRTAAVEHVPFSCVLKSYGLVQLKNQKQKRSEWELKVDCRFDLLVIALQRGGARSVLPLS